MVLKIEEPTPTLTAEEISSADRLIMAGPISLKKHFRLQCLGRAIFGATWIVLMLGFKYIEVLQHQAKATVYCNDFLFGLRALPIIVVLFIGTPLLFRYAKARKNMGPNLSNFDDSKLIAKGFELFRLTASGNTGGKVSVLSR